MTAVLTGPHAVAGASRRSAWSLAAIGSVMAGAAIAAGVSPPLRDPIITVSGIAAICVGVRAWKRRPMLRPALRLYLLAAITSTIASVVIVAQSGTIVGGTRAGPGDLLFAAAYTLMIAGHLAIGRIHDRRFVSRVLLDALIVGSGVASVLWVALIDPLAERSVVPLAHRFVLLLNPLGDCVAVTVVASIIAMSRRPAPSLYLIALSPFFSLVTDLDLLGSRMRGDGLGGVGAAAQVLTYAMFALALSDTFAQGLEHIEITLRRSSPVRMALLTVSAIGPGIAGLATRSETTFCLAVTTPLVLLLAARCADLMREWERSRDRWFGSMSAGALDMMVIIGRDGRVLDAAPGTARRLGLSSQADGLDQHVHPDDRTALKKLIRTALMDSSREVGGELRFVVEGATRFYRVVVTDLTRDPDVNGLVVNAHDVDALRKLASYDMLTGLPNRAALSTRLATVLAAPGRVAVLLVDLDGFKEVNDTFGHAAGDAVLAMTARRMATVIGEAPERCAARLGGDEFVVLCDADDATAVGDTLIEALRQPVEVQGMSFTLGASVGVRVADGGVDRPDEVLRDADIALYEAKRAGRGRQVRFERAMGEELHERVLMRARIDEAIASGEFSLVYQPKVRCRDRALVGFEALIRWTRPDGATVSPGRFIPLAEETGQIVPIGMWVLDRALAQLAAWDELLGPNDLRVAVNVSPRELVVPGFVERVSSALAQHRVAPARLVLEVTETALMTDPDRAAKLLDQVHALGIHLSIDDYGAGNASISYLRRLPVQEVKIDRSLTDGLRTGDRAATAFVRSILDLARALGLTAVAEGVEDAALIRDLDALGCQIAQGYAIAAPLRLDRATEFARAAIVARTVAGPSLYPARVSARPPRPSCAPPPN